MTAPERFAEMSDSLLHRGRRPYMRPTIAAAVLAPHCNTLAIARYGVFSGRTKTWPG
jgi:hypothetical protein